jgi:DNA replication protein DnaC
LLIIDEISYIPIDRQGAKLFFQLNRLNHRSKSARPDLSY